MFIGVKPFAKVLSAPLRSKYLSVISGFNTDIEFQGTVYHVQTEDKGAPTHTIMSLIYDQGTILASKRTSYEDLLATGVNEEELSSRLSRQHKLMCAAVKAGRLAELTEQTRKASAAARAKTAPAAVPPVAKPASPPPPVAPVPVVMPAPRVAHPAAVAEVLPVPMPSVRSLPVEPVIEAVEIIEDEVEILDADAVMVVSELSGRERPVNTKLAIELLSDAGFKGGERRTVNVMVCRGTERKVVSGAQIMIKVLGSTFRPVIFHARSDVNGLAKVHLQLPHFTAGRAAVLIRAMADGQEVELRRVVTPG